MNANLLGGDRLAMSVTHADGRVTRWGPDEPDPTNLPDDLTFSTQVPGGFKDLSCSLLRRIDLDYPDLSLFDTVRVYGAGNRTAWEGRMGQFPRSHGDGFSITPGAVGWSAHLTDDQSFTEIYVDRDPSHWTESSLARRLVNANSGIPQGKIPVTTRPGGVEWAPPNESLSTNERTELVYDSGTGHKVSRFEYRGQRVGAWTNLEAATLFTADAEDFSGTVGSTSLTLDNTARSATGFTARRYAMLRAAVSSTVTPAAGHLQTYDALSVIGNHGLPLNAAGSFNGVYASDVVADVVTRTAPLLTITEIETTSFVIPHLVFTDPTTGEDAIQFVNAYHGFPWGVYDNKGFFYRSWDPDRLTWQARLSAGARLDLEGDTAEQIFNGVYVTYSDPTGKKMTVGPPGASADATDASLADTSATNPVNAHSITRRWAKLEISQTTTQAGAIQLGAIWLLEHMAPQRRGTLTLTGTVTHPGEGDTPVWRVRAGDYVSITDHPTDVPRKIIETRYTHGTRQIVCNLDNTPYLLDAIMARLGVGLVGVL